MRITIVNGFFLPVPPVSGGSTEKSWYHLARQFAARGHHVTLVSRRWKGFPHEETIHGIRHLRLPGADHQRQLWRNLVLDFLWSWRAFFALPAADIVVVNAVALPVWLGWLKPRAGRVVLMTGRMPKGQYRHYTHIARVLAASSFVRDKVIAENPALSPLTRVCGYPIDWQLMNVSAEQSAPATASTTNLSPVLTLGFVGRIHEEKGLLLLADALKLVARAPGLPPWQLLLCGPVDIARGGSGPEFRDRLLAQLAEALPSSRYTLLEPEFDASALAAIYRRITIFCYPSLAEQGETFGVAVAEAMAAGAVPVVSQLRCFTDFIRQDETGLVFDHQAADATAQLATALTRLLSDAELRHTLAAAARKTARHYDYASYAETLLADFATLTTAGQPSPSAL